MLALRRFRAIMACALMLLPLLVATGWASSDDILVGFRLENLNFQGPGEWRKSAEPIWAADYHRLRLRYRASGPGGGDAPVLTLRPGSVGPVTPGGTNPENPLVKGRPVPVLTARDLAWDGQPHVLEIELRGKVLTPQVDQLVFSLPAGARWEIEELAFVGDPGLFPCATAQVPALPDGAAPLGARGPLRCGQAQATSLRGRESIRIEGGGRRGRALYLSLMTHVAQKTETSETASVIARVHYAHGPEEEQFPLLVSQRRHVLLGRKAALYALELDGQRPLDWVELLDCSPHVQLALFAAGLSPAAPPEAEDPPLPSLSPSPAPRKPADRPSLEGSTWFRLAPAGGAKALSPQTLRPELRTVDGPSGRRLSLAITNTGDAPVEFSLAFPSLAIRPSQDAADVYCLFPRAGTIFSREDRLWEAAYGHSFPMEWMDVFAPVAGRGLCVIVEDTSAEFKTFRLKKAGACVEAEVRYPAVRLSPGQSFRPPEASLVFHGGDWRQGLDAYRAWLKTWHKRSRPGPQWLQTAFWCRRDYPIGGTGLLFDERRGRYTFAELIRDGAAFGGIDMIDISGWGLSATAGRVGDYPIELGGPADLRSNIALAKGTGICTGLYFEGHLIDRNSAVGRHWGADWQVIGPDGRGLWWSGSPQRSPEMFVCPHVTAWQKYLASRIAAVAAEVGAAAVYLDEFGLGGARRCYSDRHGHAPGATSTPGEMAMAGQVRSALDRAGLNDVAIYFEYSPVDALAAHCDAAFSYAITQADPRLSPLKLNLSRFALPEIRLWDMLSTGIEPRMLSAEDFRLSLWHGNGVWLKGHSDTWYGEELLGFLRHAHGLLRKHAAAFSGQADPLVASPHPAVFINRFRGGRETVYTLFNGSYRTVRFSFQGSQRSLGPRAVDVVAAKP